MIMKCIQITVCKIQINNELKFIFLPLYEYHMLSMSICVLHSVSICLWKPKKREYTRGLQQTELIVDIGGIYDKQLIRLCFMYTLCSAQ